MPYAESLREFAFWFRQLWAAGESRQRKIATARCIRRAYSDCALGAMDQHSQIQLYNEGPNDKVVTFIEVEKFKSSIRVPSSISNFPRTFIRVRKNIRNLIHAERAGTAAALTKTNARTGHCS